MKRTFALVFLTSYVVFAACKGDSKKTEGDAAAATTEQTPAAGEEKKPAAANQPKEYKVTVTPDSAILGKSKEALVKVAGATAIALQDPDGKDNGIELTFKLNLTNKNKIGGSGVHVDYTKSRLTLDNGNNITCETGSGFLRAEPEATSNEETWTYKLPAGAKPTALNLFMDDTRVSVSVSLN